MCVCVCVCVCVSVSVRVSVSVSASVSVSVSVSVRAFELNKVPVFFLFPQATQEREADASTHAISHAAVERTWHIRDSPGQIMAMTFRNESLKPFMLCPLRSEAETPSSIPSQPQGCSGPRQIAERGSSLGVDF